MNAITTIAHHGRALLIQAMERRWPGCGAHTKRNQVSGREELVWSGLLAPEVQREIRAFSAGWEEAMASAVRMLQAEAPFEDAELPAPAGRPNRQQGPGKPRGSRTLPAARGVAHRDDRATRALAGLDALFAPEKPGKS